MFGDSNRDPGRSSEGILLCDQRPGQWGPEEASQEEQRKLGTEQKGQIPER